MEKNPIEQKKNFFPIKKLNSCFFYENKLFELFFGFKYFFF